MEVWLADFDNPDGSAGFLGGSTLGNDIETNLGHGDSGGASFVTSGGEYYLAGTNTLGFRTATGPSFGFFGSGMGGMLVYPYLDWIDSITPLLGVPGDVDLNQKVDLDDFGILAGNFGYDGTTLSVLSSEIPEPSALALLAVGAAFLAGRRSRKRRMQR